MKNIVSLFVFYISIFIYLNTSLSQDGQLDPSWGGVGKIKIVIGSKEDWANAVALQKDGKIIIVGASDNNFVVVRLNTDGSLDPTLGGSGAVTTQIGTSSSSGFSVTLQPDGKIVVAGYSFSNLGRDFTVVRYNTDGSLDNTFDSDGIVTTDIYNGGYDFAESVALQADGKIIVAGFGSVGTDVNSYSIQAFVVVRYNVDGSLDSTFGENGKVTTRISTDSAYGCYDNAYGVAIQADGKIIVAGHSYLGKIAPDFSLVRYNTDGSLDNTFNGDGKVTTEIGDSEDIANSVAIQADGKIILAGYTWNESEEQSDIAVVRYNVDGSLDNTFGNSGKVMTDISKFDHANSIVLQANGKIIIAGYKYSSEIINDDFLIIRYNADGSLDSTFGDDGIVTTDMQNSYDHSSSVVLKTDGRIVVAGNTRTKYSSFDNHFAVVRYMGSSGPVSVDVEDEILTKEFVLSQNYPNPFNPNTKINYSIPKTGFVILKIYDVLGNEITTLVNEEQSTGNYEIQFNGSNISSGVYFYRMQIEGFTDTKKFILIR